MSSLFSLRGKLSVGLFIRLFLGRKRKGGDYAKECVEEIVQWVRERGVFKTRRPEGKAGDH